MQIICPECGADQSHYRHKKNRIALYGLLMGDRRSMRCSGCKHTFIFRLIVRAEVLGQKDRQDNKLSSR
jgi:hypothetical protein